MSRARRRPARDRLRRLAPTALAAAIGAVYLVWQPASVDLAAAEYRAWLFGEQGFAIWNGNWYGGHHLPGYSVLFPPLAHWLGPRVVGVLAVVAAAWLFERLAHARYGARAWLGSLWFAAGATTTLFSGRLTFALGLALALAALLALQRGRLAAALALAALTPLASPVAALFLALAGAAYALGERRARGIAVATAAMAPVLALALAFPEGGIHPFAASAYWPVMAFAAGALVVLPREERAVRIGVVLYAAGATAAFLIDAPLGGNVTRLGALVAGPVAALVLWPDRRLALALVAAPLLWWQWDAAIRDVRTASRDASVDAAYHAPLLAELERRGAGGGTGGATGLATGGATGDGTRDGTGGRVEVPFTRLHWEARWLAAGAGGHPGVPLARGWERQLDLKVNPLFYGEQTGEPPLTAERYRAWLRENAVHWVALPRDLRLDYSAQDEAALIAGGLPYLREVWEDEHWRLYAVRDPAPLVDAPARVTHAGLDALAIASPRPATVRLRVRWTPYWAVVAGDACVEPDGDWTRVRIRRAGTVQLATRFAPGRIGARSPRCADRSPG